MWEVIGSGSRAGRSATPRKHRFQTSFLAEARERCRAGQICSYRLKRLPLPRGRSSGCGNGSGLRGGGSGERSRQALNEALRAPHFSHRNLTSAWANSRDQRFA